jgi:hypothetical protein
MHGMFNGGHSKEDVLGGMQAMHQSASYWEEQQRLARENDQSDSTT